MRCFGFFVAVALFVSACSSGGEGRRAGGGTGGAGIGTTGTGTGGGLTPPDGIMTDAGPRPVDLTITSSGGTSLTVSGQPVTSQFAATLKDGTQPPGVMWSVDDTKIGSIGSDGVFHANGYVGGVVTVTATLGGTTVSTKITVTVDIVDNPGAVPPGDQGALTGGGSADAAFRWLYPYEQTVFPRGLQAPSLQLAGAPATASYLKITAPYFKYQQFAAASNPVRATIPEPIWKGVTLTVSGKDAIDVELTKKSGADVAGPIKESWHVAEATLKGIVYYGTYKSPLAPNGGIMRLRPGQTAEVVQAGCTVCHTVSANGNVLATGIDYSLPEFNPTDSATYDLSQTGTIAQRSRSTEGRLFAFSALTPDGKVALVNGLPPARWPPFISRGVYAPAGFASRLVDTTTGLDIPAPSLTQMVTYAETPAFSPDGKHVAFANGDRLERRVLSMADYDGSATAPTFSNPRDLVNQAMPAVAWPSFLPDGAAVLYHEGDSFDSYIFSENDMPSLPQYAELRLVEVADKSVKTLDALNGHLPGGALYLPYGAAVEGRMNYEPNVLPVAVGGYYWVLFTSRRAYGNTIAPGGTLPRGDDVWGRDSAPSPRKKIWIAAIDVDHATKADPSHPAFYLPGQEVESGNMRAFGALAPCKAEGVTCESGSDCCGGFCRETGRSPDGVPILQCVPPPMRCSFVDEKCTTAADCCDPRNICVNNRCVSPIVPK